MYSEELQLTDDRNILINKLINENKALKEEIRVSRRAAEITAKMVVRQFEKSEHLTEKFRETNRFLSAVLNASGQLIVIAIDTTGVVRLFNNGAEELLGYSAEEVVDKPFPKHIIDTDKHSLFLRYDKNFSFDDPKSLVSVIKNAIKKKKATQDWSFRCKKGKSIPVRLTVSPIQDEVGSEEGFLIAAMDITPIKEAEERLLQSNRQLENANKELQKLDKMKSDFLSSVSHELRTPLTSIRGFAKLAAKNFKKTFLSDCQDKKLIKKGNTIAENMDIILSESERLTRLINNVLDIAKIESGRIDWNDDIVDIGSAAHQAMNAVRGQFDEKTEVSLESDIGKNLPLVYGDYDRLVQVFINLMNNAAKFTEKGKVTLVVYAEENNIHVKVKDTGCGFSKEDEEKIFDRFHQAEKNDTLSNKPHGTGLGLSICKEIVEHYDGEIWAESEIGVGSTFHVLLKGIAESETSKSVNISDEKFFSKKRSGDYILVVDDDPAIRIYLYRLMESANYNVVSASNGKEALDAVRKQRPGLVIMDLLMPEMDGKTAIEKMRNDADMSDIPIIVISAYPGIENADGDAAFPKPLNEDSLMRTVSIFMKPVDESLTQEKLSEGAVNCLIVDSENQTKFSMPVISKKNIEYCTSEELPEKLKNFKGFLILKGSHVFSLPESSIKKFCSKPDIQVLIMPDKKE